MQNKAIKKYLYTPIHWLNFQGQTTPGAGEHEQHAGPHTLLLGVQNNFTTLKNGLVVSYKVKYPPTLQCNKFTPVSIPKRMNMHGI